MFLYFYLLNFIHIHLFIENDNIYYSKCNYHDFFSFCSHATWNLMPADSKDSYKQEADVSDDSRSDRPAAGM